MILPHRRALKTLSTLLVATTLFSSLPLSSWAADEVPGTTSVALESSPPPDTISMSFDGALLKDVLLLFSQQSGLNFIASQQVENKRVTVYFENVAPKDALDAIMTANGLSYSKKAGSEIYIVDLTPVGAGDNLTTKVIKLKYMRLSSSPLDVGGLVTIDDLKKTSAPGESGSGGSASVSSDKGADKLVAKMLSSQGKLAVDILSNSLVVTDTPKKIADIERVLAEIDVPPQQVILEVYVMEVLKGIASDIGIEWGGDGGALASYSGGGLTTAFPFQESIVRQNSQNPERFGDLETGTDGLTVDEGTARGPQMIYGLISASNFAATLRAIITDSHTKVLARPRVMTQNNEAANIKLVTNQTTALINEHSTANSVTTTSESTPERTEVGITLRMTPQINEDDSVMLFLEPAVTSVAASASFTGILDPTTRLVRTMARVKDNQTLVIGGLIDNNETISKRKVPFLGDLPGIGRMFRYENVDNVNRELLIFVTPHIVRGASSLGPRSATARGEDVSLKRLLTAFAESEMEKTAQDFQDFEKTKLNFVDTESTLVKASERRLYNPLVDKQMNQAMDALSPQLADSQQMIDAQMNQSLDSLTGKKYRS